MDSEAKGFPPDIIIDILSRLPLKSLVRFRCVSKPWLYLISNSRFPYWLLNRHHLSPDPRTSLILSLGDGSVTKFYSIGCADDDDSFYVADEIEFPFVRGKSCQIKSGSCHGMLCLVVGDDTLVLWNPSIRDHRVLPLPSDISVCDGVCGFGFDSSMDDYKVASLCQGQLVLFSVKRNQWKIIGDFHFQLFNDGIATNGALYWAAGKTSTVADRILRLDLSDDVFREVSLPPNFRQSSSSGPEEDEDLILKRELRLLLKGELLCVFREYDQSIWAMEEEKDNNGGITETWTKLMTIPKFRNRDRHFQIPAEFRIYHRLYPKCFTKSGRLLFTVKGEKFFVYGPHELDYAVLRIHGLENGRFSKAIAYSESLISPDSVRGMNDID